MIPGVDYSRYESEVNAATAYQAGCQFIFHKLTDGTSYAYTGVGLTRLRHARGTGVVYGAYHFLQAGNGAAQADYLYDTAAEFLDDPLFAVQLDWESESSTPSVQDAWNFVNRWHSRTNNRPIFIYLPQWYANEKGYTGNLSGMGPLWASHYYTNLTGDLISHYSQVPSTAWAGYLGWTRPTIVQYTDAASVAGTSGLDGNAFDGDRAKLLQTIGASTPIQGSDKDDGDMLLSTEVNSGRAWSDDGNVTVDATKVEVVTVPGFTSPGYQWLLLGSEKGIGRVRVAVYQTGWAVLGVYDVDSANNRTAIPINGITKISLGRCDDTQAQVSATVESYRS